MEDKGLGIDNVQLSDAVQHWNTQDSESCTSKQS